MSDKNFKATFHNTHMCDRAWAIVMGDNFDVFERIRTGNVIELRSQTYCADECTIDWANAGIPDDAYTYEHPVQEEDIHPIRAPPGRQRYRPLNYHVEWDRDPNSLKKGPDRLSPDSTLQRPYGLADTWSEVRK